MSEKYITVPLSVPSAGFTVDVRLPSDRKISELIPALAELIEGASGGRFRSKKIAVLIDGNTGITLDGGLTLSEAGIINSFGLILD